jgi:DNA-binding SARP family transcriptional activator/tetratricopeptide (TPR) repeat protein
MTVARGSFASSRRSGPDSLRARKELYGGWKAAVLRGRSMSWHPNPDEAIRVEVFGGPRLFRLGEPIPLSSQQEAFLGFLFGNGKEVLARSQVLDLFWPREESPRARRCLNQLLYSLKRRIGDPPVFWTRRDEICWSGIRVTTDLKQFETDLKNGVLLACVDSLEMGFLERVTGTASRALLSWIESREAELRRSLRARSERAWLDGTRDEDWEGARIAAEALLRLSPLDESRLQRMLEARARTRSPEDVEEAVEEFRIRFERTHGRPWQPKATTGDLLERIRSLEPMVTPAAHEAGAGVAAEMPEPPMVGRSREKSSLRTKLKRTPSGSPPVVLVVGEAGIGKSRLIREGLAGMALDGHRIFSAGLAEFEQMIPLNPLIEAFAGSRVRDTLREMDDPWRTVLFGVMPSHYTGKHPIPEAPHIQTGSVPRRLFEAFHQFLLSLVEGGPVILVLEDLHWADETTLSVLDFLIRRWDRGGLQMVFSVRSEEAHRAPAVARFLENVRTVDGFVEIALGDLDESASEALIEHLSAEPLDAARIQYLRSLAGGNPFFLIELTAELIAGRLDQEVPASEDMVSIPFSILQVLRRRLSQLSKDAERVLETLAVYNKLLGVPGLARIVRLPADRCVGGIDQLRKLRMVVEVGAEAMIRHELIRQTVYQEMSQSKKALLHRRVAQFLLRNRENPPPDELAVHFHRAGAASEAAMYSTEAADRAEASGAFPEALRFLAIAREHSRDPEEVAALIGRMGRLNYLHQDFDKAAPLLELAAQRFRRQGKILEALDAEVQHIDCLARNGQVPHQDCLEELQRLKAEAAENEGWEIFQDALDVEIHRLDHRGDIVGVTNVLKAAKASADLGGVKARCQARATLALNVYYGSPAKALAAAREAVSISLLTQDPDLQLHALNRLIVALLYQGRLGSPEGLEALSLAEPRLATTGDLDLKFFLRLNRAVGHLEAGELDQASAAFRSAEEVIHGTRATESYVTLLLNKGELALASHDVPRARRHYLRAEEYLSISSPDASRAIINAGLGLCALKNGHLPEARDREAALPPHPSIWTFDPFVVVSFSVGMLRKRGDQASADQLLAGVTKDVRSRLVTAWIKLMLVRADLWRKRDPAKAAGFAEEALEVAKALGLTQRVHQLEKTLLAPGRQLGRGGG